MAHETETQLLLSLVSLVHARGICEYRGLMYCFFSKGNGPCLCNFSRTIILIIGVASIPSPPLQLRLIASRDG